MKYFIPLFALLLLASCEVNAPSKPAETPAVEKEVQTEITDTKAETTDTPKVDVTDEEINKELEGLDFDKIDDTAEETQEKVIKTTYKNPKGDVDMTIAYALDTDGKITDIEVSASTYDLADFSEKLQKEAIGKTVKEAAEIYISGSSLTTEAYQKAMKEEIK